MSNEQQDPTTQNHDLAVPDSGRKDWHNPLNTNFEKLDAILKNVSADGETLTPTTVRTDELDVRNGSAEETTSAASGVEASVRVASNFPGQNGGERIQNAIDDLPSGGGVVVVGPEGPDDVSGSSGSVSDGRETKAWAVSSAISWEPNTSIILKNSYLFMQDSVDDNMLISSNINKSNPQSTNRVSGYHLIGIGNPILDQNGPNQSHNSTLGPNNPVRLLLRLFRVDKGIIKNIKFRNPNGYSIRWQDCNYWHAEDIEFECGDSRRNQDGFKIMGPAKQIHCENSYGITGDDFITWESSDMGSILENGTTLGAVTDCSIKNFHHERVEGGRFGGTLGSRPVKNITISNGKMETGEDSSGYIFLSFGNERLGRHSDINIKNTSLGNGGIQVRGPINGVTVKNCDAFKKRGVHLLKNRDGNDYDWRRVRVENCYVEGDNDTGNGNIADMTGGSYEDVVIKGCHHFANGQGTLPALRISSQSTVDGVKFIENHIRGGSAELESGIVIESGASISSPVIFDNNSFDNVGTKYSLGNQFALVNGVGEESASAEVPQKSWPEGSTVKFEDSGDNSGTGIYRLIGGSWEKIS